MNFASLPPFVMLRECAASRPNPAERARPEPLEVLHYSSLPFSPRALRPPRWETAALQGSLSLSMFSLRQRRGRSALAQYFWISSAQTARSRPWRPPPAMVSRFAGACVTWALFCCLWQPVRRNAGESTRTAAHAATVLLASLMANLSPFLECNRDRLCGYSQCCTRYGLLPSPVITTTTRRVSCRPR